VVGARSGAQVEAVAQEIGGESMVIDVSDRGSVETSVAQAPESQLAGQ
jgi:NADP-dependent 3-hydroxy acid dehydrogenase YdfG